MLPFEKQKRKLTVLKEANTSDKYGKDPHSRTVDELLHSSIIILDKPSGPSSHQVSAYLKQILQVKKSGHSGTLDPKVTGVLPVAIGRGTRIVDSLLVAGKAYVALMHVHEQVDKQTLQKTMKAFTGRIKQLPPVRSAVKRQQRYRTIYDLEILDIQGQDVLFKVGCQAGTYIRKLVHDMGEYLKVGAHMTELRRTQAGPFTEEDIVTLQDVKDAYVFHGQGNSEPLKKLLLPIERGIAHLPKIWVFDTTVNTICHGANLKVPGISKLESFDIDEPVAILTLKDELIAVGTARMSSKEIGKAEKGVVLKLSQVFMQPGTYPKIDHQSRT